MSDATTRYLEERDATRLRLLEEREATRLEMQTDMEAARLRLLDEREKTRARLIFLHPRGDYTGRCTNCGSRDLWADVTAYGCKSCGGVRYHG